jgi:transposase
MRNNLAIAFLDRLDESVVPPQEREESFKLPWTVKHLVAWLKDKYFLYCCRETCRTALKKLDFSWKKARKLLKKF